MAARCVGHDPTATSSGTVLSDLYLRCRSRTDMQCTDAPLGLRCCGDRDPSCAGAAADTLRVCLRVSVAFEVYSVRSAAPVVRRSMHLAGRRIVHLCNGDATSLIHEEPRGGE